MREAEIRRITVPGQSSKKKSLRDSISTEKS
jgi:hypothetical protein